MYIIKNALRCIGRSAGRSVLIAIIVLVIAVSACLGLSIRQAAESAREDALENVNVTATISFDRLSAMGDMKPSTDGGEGKGGFDRTRFAEMMGSASALTLDEYLVYAKAQSVKDYYYNTTVSLNGDDGLSPVSTDTDTDTDTETPQTPEGTTGGGRGGFGNRVMGAQSDFTIIGYSSESAMIDFIDGTASVTEGEVFAEGGEDYNCLITEELAAYNSLSVGDSITVCNPNKEDESYTLTVCGLYSDITANQNSFSMMGMTSGDPANRIYMSYNAVEKLLAASAERSETLTDEDTGREYDTALTDSLDFTYVLADVEGYEQFEQQVREMGLDDSYTVSSSDITAFENSLAPLETLSKTAGYFLAVILIIGSVILVVLNLFSVRERKYEIGVLTAMGMKKHKVALQFITEIFVITMAAVIIGAGVGAVSAVPVTNALLENRVSSQQQSFEQTEQNFGRPQGSNGGVEKLGERFGAGDAITEITSATDMSVLMQMLGIAVLLTLVAGGASVLFIMRYEPLKILSTRD